MNESNSLTKDPICGMTVDKATARHAERDGQTYYFCCEGCHQKFLAQKPPAETAKSLEPLSESNAHCCGSQAAEDTHLPSHHADSDNSGNPARVTPSAAAKYICPMCPGVASDTPADCPKCGMALERNPAWVAPASGKTL